MKLEMSKFVLKLNVDLFNIIQTGDFGLSRFTDQITTLGKLKGTYAYCKQKYYHKSAYYHLIGAPEIYHGRLAGWPSDIYALGIVLWVSFIFGDLK
jgi:hypothetical protein